MTKASRVHSTPRKTASKKPTSKKATPQHSAITRECVRYLQSVAAFNAGFDADHGNNEIAGAGGPLGNAAMNAADSALRKLAKLGNKLSAPEMKAKAAVFKAMMKFESGNLLEKDNRNFLAAFALDLELYFREAAKSIP
jgi:hypothetical protein